MKYCTKCGSEVSESDKFCSDCGQTTGQSSNDAPVKVEIVNTNTDKAIKAVGDSISIGKKVAKKHKEATVNFLESSLILVIATLGCFAILAFVAFVF